MRNSMQRNYQRKNLTLSGNMLRNGVNTYTTIGDRHPYQKDSFWANPVNHFWETSMYSEESKEYFRNWLRTTTF